MAAAYAALVSLSHITHQILHPPPAHHFLIPAEQIESLQEQVSSLIDFLEKQSSRSSQEIEDLEKRIVGAAHEAEDIIESYVVNQIQGRYKVHPERKSSAPFLRYIQKEIREVLPFHGVLKKKAILEVIKTFSSIREELRNNKAVECLRNEGLLLEHQSPMKLFTAKELAQATDHYNKNRILSAGFSGTVYKGMLKDGRIVAIKKIYYVDGRNYGAFINATAILSQIKHRNVVQLLGCCLETEVPLLVHEFIHNGSLYQSIHGSREGFSLTWEMRVRIARETAGALAYLHSAVSQPIYHLDINSSNILLDDKYQAKISCSSWIVRNDPTELSGNDAYADPDYFESCQYTEKSDVYSFGILVAEILTGEKVWGSSTFRLLRTHFLDSMEEDQLFEILDARVRKEGRTEDIVAMAGIARRCMHWLGRHRPTMKEVAVELERIHIVKEQIMIGFDEHLKQIMTALAAYESGLQIIPVVGMGGIGKTTLATNVYNNAYIVQHFDVRSWVSISQEYVGRDIIAALLQQINRNIEVNQLNADELGNLLHKELFGRRYFIVLDDMWDIKAWDMLKMFFPNNSTRSRILVTTRLLNLAEDFNSCMPYQLSLLNYDSSWDLILEHVFRKEECPNELEEIGKSIARKCGGLPLALVVIGGLLAKSEKTTEFWEYVEENVTCTANDHNDEECMQILRLSYSQLPVYLKPCFLYLAVFPKNVEIRMSRLIKLWVAEGFIKPASGKTLEEVAEQYLKDLFQRNLIMVSKRGHTGKVKTWSIHDLVRDLCTREVHRERFLCIANLDNPNISPHMKSERRLSIHIGTAKEEACEVLRSATLNRSFLSYSKWESRRCVARSLNLLRLLDVVDSYSMEEILQLFNSRYITCNIPWELHAVSSLLSLLWNLQTLVVPGPVSLPTEIWQMPQLRHLKMPGITLPDPPDAPGEFQSITVLENLQTLSTVKNFIFREQVLERIPNLKKLGIHCDANEKLGYFCLSNLVSLKKLESLVLAFRGTWENMAFPKSLKKLSLSYCQIPWEDMFVVGSLPNLEVLKLQTLAAKGRTWNPNANEFCRLKFLLIDQCEMETWVADDSHFPCLEHLHLVNMKMEEIPVYFAEITTLQIIELNYCSRSLFSSAKNISKERETFGYDEIQVRSSPSEAPGLRKDNVVGLEDEVAKLIAHLTKETLELDVISIVGIHGIGKTTLADKIFHDPVIQYEFPTRIWVYVSQKLTMKNVFLAILKRPVSVHKCRESELELAELVAKYLGSRKFLLVLDDVWKPEDWDIIQIALPKNNKRGKVLITSLSAKVGGWPHMKHFLTQEDSFLLLQLDVFGKSEYPAELEDVGRLIAKACRGLPLAILIIGGILLKSFSTSSEMSATRKAWEEVSDILATYLDYDPTTCMEQIISLNYQKLPYHLKKCFLYMGMFPQDFEIPTWRLIWLWIAEGLIQSNSDMSMEETAEYYLEDLISRNLVRADKLKVSGKVKSCRIHNLLYDFCKIESGNERDDFFQELKMTRQGVFQPPITVELKWHRLCVHSNILSFAAQKPYGPSVHSLVCFSTDETTTPAENVSAIPSGFKQLRILDVSPIKFTELPSDMFQLLHLTYIALSGVFSVLPAAFSKFGNIQTLIVDTTLRTLDVKVDILNMIQLRHFRTNVSSTLPRTSTSNKGGEQIQTLRMISPESCTAEVFDRARNLKKMVICGELNLFLEHKNRLFDSLGRLENLEKLGLLIDVDPLLPSEGSLHVLAPAYKFPNKLRRLTLSETCLDWNYMSVLGSLENLEVLKLKDNAFRGEAWEAADGGFPNLEVLHIGWTNLRIWVASNHHFPRLKRLQLNKCYNLQQVPIGLADIPNFQLLDLYHCEDAAESALKIAEKKQEDQQSGNGREFKLNIFPPY
ncbi:hypothetical protein C2S53_012807 [Perilla frutescens var. hirtella]|uniref:Protein kinase domain-containing protein n=1 Tax=Perilla frutescens var. hirtella TaxID=608512 RepID=A0AAD4JDX0_PERFH|nr:hypothetical protein C2S53_012807 [Perilla frutescens var. hirtella]